MILGHYRRRREIQKNITNSLGQLEKKNRLFAWRGVGVSKVGEKFFTTDPPDGLLENPSSSFHRGLPCPPPISPPIKPSWRNGSIRGSANPATATSARWP